MEEFESKVQIELKSRREKMAERYKMMSFAEIQRERQEAVENFFGATKKQASQRLQHGVYCQ